MLVGVPKEIKAHEYRVGLTPSAVREYVAHGHKVLVESDAGAGIGAHDDAYRAAGAEIAADAAEVFAKSAMIVKVKEPQASEWVHLHEGQILFTSCISPLTWSRRRAFLRPVARRWPMKQW